MPELPLPPAPASPVLAVQNGTFTVSHREVGHYTLKLHTAVRGQLTGKRILSLLIGPDNTVNFRGVAFWDDAYKRANVWTRHRGPDSHLSVDGYNWQEKGWSRIEQKLAIWCDLAVRGTTNERHGHWFTEGYSLLLEARCVVCNKKLTTPESILSGIGPVCAGRA